MYKVLWTSEEEDILRDLYSKRVEKSKICELLNRSKDSVSQKAKRLGIKLNKWTKEENNFLINNYRKYIIKDLTKKLNRSYDAVAQRLSKLKLIKSPQDKSKLTLKENRNYSKGKNHYKWKGGKPEKVCEICGKKFIGEWGNPNRFCSVSCSLKTKKRRGENHHFWNGGEKNWKRKKYLYSSTLWKDIRLKILKEDKGCKICGTTENLDVHHKIRYKDGGKNTRENLIALCNSHHHKIHALEIFYKNNHSPKEFQNLLFEVTRKYKNPNYPYTK